MSELKPCPFCGGEAEIHRWSIPNKENRAQVRCKSILCGARSYEAHEPMTQDEVDEIAIGAWNRRAGAERLREELADAPKCEACVAMLDCDECLRADGSHKERRRLSAENAKLRELVKRTWLFANRAHEAAYELCPDRSDPHALATISALTLNAQDVAVRMRELGIEVD